MDDFDSEIRERPRRRRKNQPADMLKAAGGEAASVTRIEQHQQRDGRVCRDGMEFGSRSQMSPPHFVKRPSTPS